MAAKSDNIWLNLGIIIKLSAKNMVEGEKKLFEIENKIVILQKTEKFDYNTFKNLIETLSKGILNICGVDVTLENFSPDYVRKERELETG
jgi:hypothetical protein